MARISQKTRHAGGRPREKKLSPFGQRLDYLLVRKGISRNDLAKTTGINNVTIWRWMVGLSEPTLSAATKLAHAAGGKLTDLVPKKAG
jgi:transcriptional regulator with XRE-family HTH domain